jgi:phospholipid/cholesterol/gamma-HCH transport system ATP-binding protein
MINIVKLTRTMGGVPVLCQLDLTVNAGEVLALIGPSGTGKSVLLKHIVGLLEPDSGSVTVAGRCITGAGYRELAEIRRGLGYVFQDAALLDSLSIRDNLRLALDDSACARDPQFAEQRITDSLAAVNLPERVLTRRPGELSGGMRKRAGVARAIINQPRVLLYDEPTTGLDPGNVAAINRLILRNRDRFNAASIVITHDIASLPALADRVALLDGGSIQFLGTPDDLLMSDNRAVLMFTGRTTATSKEEDPWPDTLAVAM